MILNTFKEINLDMFVSHKQVLPPHSQKNSCHDSPGSYEWSLGPPSHPLATWSNRHTGGCGHSHWANWGRWWCPHCQWRYHHNQGHLRHNTHQDEDFHYLVSSLPRPWHWHCYGFLHRFHWIRHGNFNWWSETVHTARMQSGLGQTGLLIFCLCQNVSWLVIFHLINECQT